MTAKNDPYSQPNGCLRNKIGIADPEVLREVEARVVSIRDVELAKESLPGEYNLEHYQGFHGWLFRDVYEWAGELRSVDIAKDGLKFANWHYLSDQVSATLSNLREDQLLVGRNRSGFVSRLAYYYGELNALHPNARADRRPPVTCEG